MKFFFPAVFFTDEVPSASNARQHFCFHFLETLHLIFSFWTGSGLKNPLYLFPRRVTAQSVPRCTWGRPEGGTTTPGSIRSAGRTKRVHFSMKSLRHRLLRPPPSRYSAKTPAEHTPGRTGFSISPPKAALFPRGVRDPIHNVLGTSQKSTEEWCLLSPVCF